MSDTTKITAEERKWLRKVQKVIDECPSNRLGFFTTGDNNIVMYDSESYDNLGLRDSVIDPAPAIESNGLILGSIFFPDNVEGLCG